jgi:hypothetical protein
LVFCFDVVVFPEGGLEGGEGLGLSIALVICGAPMAALMRRAAASKQFLRMVSSVSGAMRY